ncbi:PD-(D/E)XK motif protein [Cryobacterium sp. Y57]|uniref:PD-(D/E)XK motif protein n=1 Tax=Cryobacterium sp. Y57 TaxID=2048287 RepID=UPI000CE4395F|nr:PD-(D/E)XK motif protein [Cryobacterium sp. Y57]
MTSPSLESLFQQVLKASSGRMVIIGRSPVMFAAVNDNGRAALFIRVSLTPSQIVSDGQGFSVQTTRSGKNDYVQITATDRGLPPLFLKLVEYVLERVGATSSVAEGVEVLTRSIDEYRRFVGQRRGRLSESLVRGTFAELLLMRKLIDSGMNAENAVTAWRGPWAKAGLGVHDFTFSDGRGIEVKSTHQPPGTIRVSSSSQLVPLGQQLDLVVLPFEDAPVSFSAAISFRKYARETGEVVSAAGPRAAAKWDLAIEALSLDLSDEWYDRYRFLPGEWRRFEVSLGFPHLDIPSLPPGIIDVRYSLELLRLTPFIKPFGELLREMGLRWE